MFTYLHLAGNASQAFALAETGVTAIAYETVTSDHEPLPLLSPMSEIAGQLAFVVGSNYLLKHNMGVGKLLGYSTELDPAIVTVVGAGAAGKQVILKAVAQRRPCKQLLIYQYRNLLSWSQNLEQVILST